MLSFVLLATAFLSAYSDSECFFDIERLRCWCRDKTGLTIFRWKHEKGDESTWSVQYDATDKECGPEDVINVLPSSWFNDLKNNDADDDPCSEYIWIKDPDLEKDMINKGFERIGHSLYKLYTDGNNWDLARRTCMEEGSHLAIINSWNEAQYLSVLLKNKSSLIVNVENKDSVYVGFHDIFEEGEYLTIEGVPLEEAGFNTWAPNKPDNCGLINEGEPGSDCGGLFKTGTLIDLYCDGFYAFICEVELRLYRKLGGIDYSNGVFKGKEEEEGELVGTEKRKKSGLGYQYYAGFGFYRYHTTPVVWDNARLWCHREGAYLVIINSEEELDLLKAIVRRVPKKFIRGKYKNFSVYTGKPSYDNETLSDERVTAESCRSSEGAGSVDGVQCQVKHVFVCEKNLYE